MIINWFKKHVLKLNTEKKEERKIVIDSVLEWTIFIEEFGA